ncbi:hypothetical protein ACHAWU_005132 [Discostella pseudostelligera]|uniref:Uncharacterized protein n=1 Tax=Discostella pseudostelligera TaxID=259834 RepID=A0ABD3M8M6_9STRA
MMIATSYGHKRHYNSSSTALEDVATYGYGTAVAVRQDDDAGGVPAPADDSDSECGWGGVC